jgi:hypothetical protein
MRTLTLLALALLALPPAAASVVPGLPPESPAPAADVPSLCPPRDRNDTYVVLYCAAVHGIPKALDQYYDNMTKDPLNDPPTANESVSHTRLFVYRVRNCFEGRYPPCPRMVVEGQLP